ncbi:MAG: dihydropteroate synthase [Actinomycetales bacterium]|nr:dihydropteroate synthase [Actinomycetales bacterium]
MGVLNVTPDSFSDGGRYLDVAAAVAHGVRLRDQGADLIDVGGESTRPGAQRIAADLERERVLPVITELVDAGVRVSIDTMRAETAAAAVGAGACLVNDVSGGLADPDMHAAVAELGVPYVAMHWRAHSDRMEALAQYDDVVRDVVAELQARVSSAVDAGLPAERIVLDPGLGFAKDADHNWALLHELPQLLSLGLPVLIGASRKRFLGALLPGGDGQPRPVDQRDDATDAVTAIAAGLGVWGVRVHDVAASGDAVRVAAAWRRGRADG